MFYSQIILAKKGPLGQLWLAAHFQDRKLSRPQIFATDITASVDSIVHPQVPLALRVSGHLLLGVVRIYSKKVHYLWQDCHQAMVQIQMAFMQQQQQQSKSPQDQTAAAIDMDPSTRGEGATMSARRRRTRDNNDDDDYDAEQDAVALMVPATTAFQGFQIPFDLNDDVIENAQDWVPAELDKEDDDDGEHTAAALGLPTGNTSVGSPERRNLARAAADLTLDDTFMMGDGRSSTLTQTEEEQWTAFDPDDGEDVPPPVNDDDAPMPMPDDDEEAPMPMPDDDEDVPMAAADTSSLQAEVPRADESLASEVEAGRASALENAPTTEGGPRMSEAEFSMPQDVSGIAPLDDEDEGLGAAGRASSLALDQSSATSVQLGHDDGSTAAVSLGDGSGNEKKRKSSTAPKKRQRRKRRKIRANEGEIELSSGEIRNMLSNTDAIVKRPPPMGEEDDEMVDEDKLSLYGLVNTGASPILMEYLTYEQLFSRPALADDGECSPELIRLFKEVARLRDTAPEENEDGSVEVVRQQAEEDEKASADGDSDSGAPMPVQEDDEEMSQAAQDEEAFPPQDDEDAPPIFPDDDEPPPLPEEDDEEEAGNASGRNSSFDLGLVNAFGDEDWGNAGPEEDEDTRQEAGDELVSSNSKWHKHTRRVYSLLKERMDGDEAKETHLSYNAMTEGCSRRTAVGVYFELLQLKTWDFIELNQDDPYGDIIVSPGVKFAEPVPK
eukprot:CAMPEP_0172451550 /NCGR_PEP_ID=MMETSP1065-20121228/9552_1 /TAXON_ID=265537 /ORGANISM="Amphiprora paludosa, Strain CCMP125" /LENGTH=723 /DNA_ID=CAMNT_0013203513 /DNA_START=73 /DNA_END=2244 /DNA_ORIENTATION=+